VLHRGMAKVIAERLVRTDPCACECSNRIERPQARHAAYGVECTLTLPPQDLGAVYGRRPRYSARLEYTRPDRTWFEGGRVACRRNPRLDRESSALTGLGGRAITRESSPLLPMDGSLGSKSG